MHRRVILLTLLLLAPASMLFAVAIGSVAIDPATLWRVLQRTPTGVPHTLLVELRLPRAIVGFVVGGMLALAGSLLQVLFRNPLADHFLIGVVGRAAVAAILAAPAG